MCERGRFEVKFYTMIPTLLWQQRLQVLQENVEKKWKDEERKCCFLVYIQRRGKIYTRENKSQSKH